MPRASARPSRREGRQHHPRPPQATYTPSVDTGDFVVIINAEKVVLTGKKEEQNEYMFFSGFVGGESYRKVSAHARAHPEFIIEHAVKGMLPEEPDRGQDADEAPRVCGSETYARGQNPVKISA
jgi:large subunit ribosomal protein L13